MDNFQVIKDFQHFPFGASFIDESFFSIVYEKANRSFYENYALVDTLLAQSQLQKIEEKFKLIDRKPAIYFENRTDLESNKVLLELNNYSNSWNDSWLFYENEIQSNYISDEIKEVKSQKDLEIFLQTFDACYQKDDPHNPYGEVKEYLNNSRERWMKYNSSNHVRYFIGYDKTDPVAVAALTSYKGLGYISAVGSLQKVRGKGFGKKVSLFAVFTSQQMGNNLTFLLTEVGTHPYEFYKRIGFVEKFTAVGKSK